MTLRKTALHSLHQELGGRMVDFAGWSMPVQYKAGALKEHKAVRQSVGLFDVSHMGEIEITGPQALQAAQRLTCNDLSKAEDGQAQYSAFLTPEGTFVDDIVVYRFSARRIFICVNAANREKDFEWVVKNLQGDAEARDVGDAYSQLAVQGPRSQDVLQRLTSTDLSQIRYYRFETGQVDGADAIISRTGYTGEKGFEIYLDPRFAEQVFRSLMKAGAEEGIQPAGLAARNTLRLEVCYPLYGNDIDATTTPLEAGLGWIAKLKGDNFIGRQALLDQKEKGVQRKLAAFEMVDRGIARDGYSVYLGDELVGPVTSGSYGPSVEKNVGLTYLPADACQEGQELQVDIRGRRAAAVVVSKPFLKKD
ncbi:MAG TPA: glycine cleavage system aminomethyltransferase GcvT [Acidobacteriota bacterium]|nr:glycine cleavage system aminomethyltransferase GcvT [Acidobacteriota bacterium]